MNQGFTQKKAIFVWKKIRAEGFTWKKIPLPPDHFSNGLSLNTMSIADVSKMKANDLSNSNSVHSRIYRNGQAYRQQNRILALRERREGRPCGGKMS